MILDLRSPVLLAVLGLLLSTCTRGRAEPERSLTDPQCLHPKGDPAQMTTQPGEQDLYGFALRIGPLQACGVGHGKALIIEGMGKRHFVHRYLDFKKRCQGKERPEADCLRLCKGRPLSDEACDLVFAIDFANEVRHLLEAAGHLASVGIAGCDERSDEAGFGRVTLIVYDWAAADLAIETLADRMRALRIGDSLRLAIKPIACGVAL